MKTIKERPIGEVFDYAGFNLEVVENKDDNCEGCFFQNMEWCRFEGFREVTGLCSATWRDDKKGVIFKDVTALLKDLHIED